MTSVHFLSSKATLHGPLAFVPFLAFEQEFAFGQQFASESRARCRHHVAPAVSPYRLHSRDKFPYMFRTVMHAVCCETLHRKAIALSTQARPSMTRREVLKAFAATPLIGCAGDSPEPADTRGGSSTELPSMAQDPTWTSAIPTVVFSQGSAAIYDLKQHTLGFDPTMHEMAVSADSASLGPAVMLDSMGVLKYDGTRPVGSTSGVIIEIRDRART